MARPAIARAVPSPENRFEPVRDRYGWRLALVFGNHAPGGFCPYYTTGRCAHCDIGAGEGAAFDHVANRRRLAWFRAEYAKHLATINHLVLYNSGSVLNPREMPPDLLNEIITFSSLLPAARVISLDSRETFIRAETLRRLFSVAGSGLVIRPILGIESADDHIRNEVLKKAMPRTAVERVFRDVGRLAAEVGSERVGLDVNIVVAGPGTTERTAVEDAVITARWALASGARHGVRVDLNLHPYYVGARGSARFPEHGRCSLETTCRAASAIAGVVRSMAACCALFIGWHDEGHDRDREQRRKEIALARGAFERFNETNDPEALPCLEQSFGPPAGRPGR
jgi:hypothetical protein